jgi:transcription antitermination factor NusG
MEHCDVLEPTTLTVPALRDGASLSRQPNWYALYVRSRHEFVAYDELLRKGIPAFLPSCKRTSQWKDRKKQIESPLFPGYVFFQTAPSAEVFLSVLQTRGVVAIISQEPGRPTPVASEELHALRLLVESGRELDLYPGLQEGMKVRLKSGPLKDAEGILDKKADACLFLVNVSLLGRCVSIRLSARDIEAV